MTELHAGYPLAHEVRELSMEDYNQLTGHALPTKAWLEMSRTGMGLFLEETEPVIWAGAVSPNLHPHDRWLYKTRRHGDYTKFWNCKAELAERHGDSPTESPVNLQFSLTGLRLLLEDTNTLLTTVFHAPSRSLPWLLAHELVFGHAEATLVALTSERLNWMAIHDILHHHDTWCEANGVVGMPQDIALRMQGLGAVIDRRRNSPFYTTEI